ncbi:UNC93-like protein MFSD11 [Drosophila santomea]|uniref:UNC93-like protein MFSD11 n=1 Tax=Drosophila santomea TaxID=129105 RepID=UPI001952D56A|nr:UNC93-like protein MFSD11 [Drosophila santomea]XP_039492993.1 UNC93-like protein MFSD11 [Drosophila santomea]
MDFKFLMILILGFGFMFVFTAFQTMCNIEKTILDSIAQEDDTFKGEGYTSLAIIYLFFSLSNWLAPSFISFTGPRVAMVVGALTYTAFMITFMFPSTVLLYVGSAVLGLGASITWTGQGTYLARCSESSTISRNSGVFWALLQCSMFIGNLFVYYQFQDKTRIDKETRNLVIGVLTVIAVLGIVFLAALRFMPDNAEHDNELEQKHTGCGQAIYALKSAGQLFLTKKMLLLSLAFFYTGLELSFFSGVFGSAIGFTTKIAETPKEIVGLVGICIGAGEVFGGGLFGILGNKTTRYGRDPIVIAGYVMHMAAFFMTFINLPNSAPFKDTTDISYLDPPRASIALVCAFLLGLGDACFNTQIYSMLGGEYVNNAVGAFALFKFTQSVAAAISFFYSSHFGLYVQLGILVVTGTIGTIAFVFVEWGFKRQHREQEALEK